MSDGTGIEIEKVSVTVSLAVLKTPVSAHFIRYT